MRIVLHIFVFIGFLTSTYSQTVVSDPRKSSFWNKPQQIGFWLGFGGAMQNNTLIADQCNCSFENGGGMASTFGLSYEDELTKNIVWGAGFEYKYITMDSRYQEIESLVIDKTASGIIANINAPFRHNAQFSVSSIGLMPYIKVFPFDTRLFIRGGFSVGANLSPTLEHTKQLLLRSTVLSSGETVLLSLDPSSDPRVVSEELAIIQSGEMPKAQSLFYGVHGGLGVEFRLGKRMMLGTTMLYTIPLSGYSSYPKSDFSITTLQVLAEMRVALD